MNLYLHTLGCLKNLVDAEDMASRLMAERDRLVAPRVGPFGRARITNATATRLIAALA